MQKFATIYQRAVKRKGEQELIQLLAQAKPAMPLHKVSDAEMLREMTKCVFRSGFVWKIIEAKWPGFETGFHQFDVTRCAMQSDEELERLGQDETIVRHGKKIASVRANAQYILAVREEHGSFGNCLAAWPEDDFVELWNELRVRGNRLGGQTGRFFLRFVGHDTPMLSQDVIKALTLAAVVDKSPTSKAALQATQEAFNQWRSESGRSYTEISRILALSVP